MRDHETEERTLLLAVRRRAAGSAGTGEDVAGTPVAGSTGTGVDVAGPVARAAPTCSCTAGGATSVDFGEALPDRSTSVLVAWEEVAAGTSLEVNALDGPSGRAVNTTTSSGVGPVVGPWGGDAPERSSQS